MSIIRAKTEMWIKKEMQKVEKCEDLCAKPSAKNSTKYQYCYISTEASNHSRRCFITGEYCSKQPRIQRERKKLHQKKSITAFVVMNFSDMSNVVYKWRLRTFIETLKKYLYLDKKNGKLFCSATDEGKGLETWEKVEEIRVVRSDSDPASNYVICNRICQQMQIADLVIVDVSSQNANVFYEFGMAVAFGKLILPICYSESFYKMEVPPNYVGEPEKYHIGCYPWRKNLFEYYGIRYKRKESGTRYLGFKEITKLGNTFQDIKYDRFPYHEPVREGEGKVGQALYEKLRQQYNDAGPENNTLIVYTMNGFLNGEQAGCCIVNFYRSITARMVQEQCFCGERVGVLVQENFIPESEKDAENKIDLHYSVGDIIHIGLNQATYLAAEEKIETNDLFCNPEKLYSREEKSPLTDTRLDEIKRFVKGYMKNRGMIVYPNNPVFVERMKNLHQEDLLEESRAKEGDKCNCCQMDAFCLYHVMLRTLRYTNEIVVDVSNNFNNNCLQSLFWLGVAHGSDIYAITVMHEEADNIADKFGEEKKGRNIFDIAGLWTAILRKYDTEGFYQELALAQMGIEQHSRLMIPNRRFYEKSIQEYLSSFGDTSDTGEIDNLKSQKQSEEEFMLESYYRDRFWRSMLRYNRLRIYVSQRNELDKYDEPKVSTARWDFDAASALSHYLSKRTVIGEYLLIALPDEAEDAEAKSVNFICIGSFAKPIKDGFPNYIYEHSKTWPTKFEGEYTCGFNRIHMREVLKDDGVCGVCDKSKKMIFKGFECIRKEDEKLDIFTQHPQSYCVGCENCNIRGDVDPNTNIIYSKEVAREQKCCLNKENIHYEIAQLILWREESEDVPGRSYFRVGVMGCSGPATYGLSALLVDEEQREKYFEDSKGNEEKTNLLCELQAMIRKNLMEVFFQSLLQKLIKKELSLQNGEKADEEHKRRYFKLVKYVVAEYLRTILYRYFFPFLSEKDIYRIYNGMYTFLITMKSARISPFVLGYTPKGDSHYKSAISDEGINMVIKLIPEVLLSVLQNFKGLEAFYQIRVSHEEEKKGSSNAKGDVAMDNGEKKDKVSEDTRKLLEIQMLEADVPKINCFFDFEAIKD